VPAPDFTIRRLGPGRFESPLAARGDWPAPAFVDDEDRILWDDRAGGETQATLELAGPRRTIFFDPAAVRLGIVTCGGLCPGLNDVVRGLVMEAWHRYGVRRILGLRYGFRGLVPALGHVPLTLVPEDVAEIHKDGGTILGTSRGPQDPAAMADGLATHGIDVLFAVGGDGTMRGALALAAELERRGATTAVVGIPKTIDNDLEYLDKSFGFETAYAEAVEAIVGAHNEARAVTNGIGLVQLMGRYAGFIACHATLATSEVNFCLVPEAPFALEGNGGFLAALRRRLAERGHAVVVVAEGAGQHLFGGADPGRDASGNPKLHDIAGLLAERIRADLGARGVEHALKRIDPSYIIRSVPARPPDSVYCWRLAQNAVHAAMSGCTEMVVGQWHGRLVHLPMRLVVSGRKRVDPAGDLWLSVLESTGQPPMAGA
jgi:6-phosphofructokinase 1